MTAQNFGCLKQILTQDHRCVVVSAVGKEHPTDQKTTDLLIAHYNGDGDAWKKIAQKYKKLVSVNGVEVDVERLLHDAKQRSLQGSLAYCMSLGEELSAKIAAKYLKCAYIEAEGYVCFDSFGKLQWKQTKNNLKSLFQGLERGVIGGFYGGSTNGRQVFSRGGSDVTGAICALATSSSLYENFTDVNGVCVANPKVVPFAETVANLSYAEMYLLAQSGAEVLHPDAVRFAQKRAIPIRVANYLNVNAADTLVSNCPSKKAFLSVTQREIDGKTVTTVLHRMSFNKLQQYLCELSEVTENCHANKILWCKTNEVCVQICSKRSILPTVYGVFCKANNNC